jgi:RHS repeat-associated protein
VRPWRVAQVWRTRKADGAPYLPKLADVGGGGGGICDAASYYRARYYDPVTARFLSRDPEDADVTDPATLNRYAYAGSDPVNHIDPTGRENTMEFPLITGNISLSQAVIRGLQTAAVAIACADLWIGSRTYAYSVAGPYGTVEMVAPCLWVAKKPRGHSDPIPYPGTPNPGHDPNEPNKCVPCPAPSPFWEQQGAPGAHGCASGIHFHWYVYNQKPYPDCTCMPARMDGCVPPIGSKPWTPGGPPWP